MINPSPTGLCVLLLCLVRGSIASLWCTCHTVFPPGRSWWSLLQYSKSYSCRKHTSHPSSVQVCLPSNAGTFFGVSEWSGRFSHLFATSLSVIYNVRRQLADAAEVLTDPQLAMFLFDFLVRLSSPLLSWIPWFPREVFHHWTFTAKPSLDV